MDFMRINTYVFNTYEYMCLTPINTSTGLSIVDTYTVAHSGNPVYIPREISNLVFFGWKRDHQNRAIP